MSDTLSREQIEACKESFLDEQKVFPPGSLGYQMLADNITICDMALLSAAPVAWAYIHAGECEEIGWGLPPEAVEDEATLLYAAPQQKLAASEPVAWHDLDQMTVYTPVKPTIPGTWTPLYASPPRTQGEKMTTDGHIETPLCGFDRNASHAAGRYVCTCGYEPINAGARGSDTERVGNVQPSHAAPAPVAEANSAAKRWYAAASPYATPEALKEALQKAERAEAQLERQIVQNNRDAERFREALAENTALRDPVHMDAERYRWFRLQGLWDSEHFPWPDGFEYPEGISEAEMLDAAIDAVRKA